MVQRQKAVKFAKDGTPRNGRGQWIKGTSGNSLGRPRTALAELCRLQITKRGLVAVLGEIASRSGQYGKKYKGIPITVSDQINAIRLLLLYGFGVPKAEIDGADHVKIEVTYDNRSINIANAASGAGEDHSANEAIQRRLLRPEVWQDDSGDGSSDSSGPEG